MDLVLAHVDVALALERTVGKSARRLDARLSAKKDLIEANELIGELESGERFLDESDRRVLAEINRAYRRALLGLLEAGGAGGQAVDAVLGHNEVYLLSPGSCGPRVFGNWSPGWRRR
jgi:hypothetical protein